MSRPISTLAGVAAALLATAFRVHADVARNAASPFNGATIVSAIRTELGTPRLDAVSRTLDVDGSGHRITEPALGRVLCGSLLVEQVGQPPVTVAAGEPLVLAPGSVVRARDQTTRIVTVNVIPKFDGMVP